ncbi:hypothetical protein ATANTOWER_031614 [Ataeniobius toweri]|uniref:Uncharacterized protein n=1 Tax=Ataeniobius toweri TaxID=208326 RepID=A0ABU7C2X3_9TELE|nr:hypothetical protein [Ataeniobius toweri]
MTPLDPVWRVMSCQQRDISARVSLSEPLGGTRVEEIEPLERWGLIRAVASWEVRCYSPFPKLLEVMQFILKVPEKSVPHVVNHGCGSQHFNGFYGPVQAFLVSAFQQVP